MNTLTVEQANEIMARECGYPLDDDGYSEGMTDDEGQYYRWTIEDPRCREIVREKFKIETMWLPVTDRWTAYVSKALEPRDKAYGKTIEEAEIAVILQIAEKLTAP